MPDVSPLPLSAAATPSILAVLAMVGFLAGLVDSIAGGGGLLTVPALMAAGLPPHVVLGTNKGQAVFGAISSLTSFWRRGYVDRDRVPISFSLSFAGAIVGAEIVFAIHPAHLQPIVLVLLVAAAVVVMLRRPIEPTAALAKNPRLALAALAFGMGAYDGFFGPGTGSLLIVGNALLFGDTLTRASGNAKVTNLASNVAAVALFAYGGKILWQVALPMAAANVIGAFVGARLAVRRGDRFVRAVVLMVVLALVVKLAVDLVRP